LTLDRWTSLNFDNQNQGTIIHLAVSSHLILFNNIETQGNLD